MASIILENCQIVIFNKDEKILKIHAKKNDFPGHSELNANLKNQFQLTLIEIGTVTLLQDLKEIRKQELIQKEMDTEEFKKVLAKFPNAKILDIEEFERNNENDG